MHLLSNSILIYATTIPFTILSLNVNLSSLIDLIDVGWFLPDIIFCVLI